MNTIETLYLFIHAPAKGTFNEGTPIITEIEDRWKKFVVEKAEDPKSAVCIIQGGPNGDADLVETASAAFGDRCVVDPDDWSDAAKCLMQDDLERCIQKRGNHGEWNIYELWSSNNARRWTEGLIKKLRENGYTYNPESLRVETFGNWTGCHHKYTNYMNCYLGAKVPAHAHASRNMCVLKNAPIRIADLSEERKMDRGVMLYLFTSESGVPMAQFWDGLRPVWEPPHLARISIDPAKVRLYTLSPNTYIPVDGASRAEKDGVVMDVGDGAKPAFTTMVGLGKIGMEEFSEACLQAEISRWERKVSVHYTSWY